VFYSKQISLISRVSQGGAGKVKPPWKNFPAKNLKGGPRLKFTSLDFLRNLRENLKRGDQSKFFGLNS
jgi:hypothetical protein